MPQQIKALEFFAGIGLARAGMQQSGIEVVWANDLDATKCAMYTAQWGDADLCRGDVFEVNSKDLPTADIAWASSPCTDLSLAGKREGLVAGRESSAFFGFMDAIEGMGERSPRALVLENVCGLASSHGGDDFRTVVSEFNRLGYSVDAFELNARRWLPQSRPRMFVVGLKDPTDGGKMDSPLRPDRLAWIHGDRRLVTHLSPILPAPPLLSAGLQSVVENLSPEDSRWWDDGRCSKFVQGLSDVQHARFKKLVAGAPVVRTAYRRTRNGRSVWEIRDDDIAGCLRTARGGSSKQALVFMGDGVARMRWMTGLEYARLQGAGDFNLKGFTESQIQYAFGDAVAVPAVRWLMYSVVLPCLRGADDASGGEVIRYAGGARAGGLLRVV